MEKVDKVFIRVDGFLPDELSGKKIGIGWGSGCSTLHNLIHSIAVRGSVHVVWDSDHAFGPVNQGVHFLQPGSTKDNILISAIDDVEENLVDDAFNSNKHGGDEFDDSCIIVGAINILGADGFGETVVGEFVSFDKSPIKAVD